MKPLTNPCDGCDSPVLGKDYKDICEEAAQCVEGVKYQARLQEREEWIEWLEEDMDDDDEYLTFYTSKKDWQTLRNIINNGSKHYL